MATSNLALPVSDTDLAEAVQGVATARLIEDHAQRVKAVKEAVRTLRRTYERAEARGILSAQQAREFRKANGIPLKARKVF